jgi:hypothetical protein
MGQTTLTVHLHSSSALSGYEQVATQAQMHIEQHRVVILQNVSCSGFVRQCMHLLALCCTPDLSSLHSLPLYQATYQLNKLFDV